MASNAEIQAATIAALDAIAALADVCESLQEQLDVVTNAFGELLEGQGKEVTGNALEWQTAESVE